MPICAPFVCRGCPSLLHVLPDVFFIAAHDCTTPDIQTGGRALAECGEASRLSSLHSFVSITPTSESGASWEQLGNHGFTSNGQ